MRISCPTCRTTYDLPEPKLRGRELRCASCKQTWTPLPATLPAPGPTAMPIPSIAPVASLQMAPAAPVRAQVSRPRRDVDWRRIRARALNPVLLGWIGTAAICASGIWAAYHARSAIMRVWPPSIRLYHALALLVRFGAAMTGHHRPGP